MSEKQYHWHKIAESRLEIAFHTNNMAVVEAGGKKLTLARTETELLAFAYKCPHASGIFCDGFLDPLGNVVCPLHRYKFNMKNGRNTSGEGYYLKTYLVQERADGVYIGLEAGGGFFNKWR
jgi:nitrite reductase/ring-hydroxylating ferredoxin subunit